MNKVTVVPPEKNVKVKRHVDEILPSTFFLMKFCGLWQSFYSTPFLKVVYNAYTIFTMFTMITVGLSLVCVILFSSRNIKEVIVENTFLLFTLLNGWVKAILTLFRYKDIKSLLHLLLEEQCQPLDSVELEIQEKFDTEAKKITVNYSILVILSAILWCLKVFSQEGDRRIELLNVWRPYDLKVQTYFWITWIHEFVGHIVTASVHLSVDTLIPGLMIQLCCQLKFFRHRLHEFPYQMKKIEKSLNFYMDKQKWERFFISTTVTHQNIIYQVAKKLKSIFFEVLFIQFSISLIVICFSVYKISKENTLDYASVLTLSAYVGCMLTQLFLFCWYGNELFLNTIFFALLCAGAYRKVCNPSYTPMPFLWLCICRVKYFLSSNLQDVVPEINWLYLEEGTKKNLIIMMIRSRKPILISAGSVIFFNLDSFMIILKASYSAYNVLQHSI